MAEILTNTDGVYLPYEKFVKLRVAGELNLGVLDDTAGKLLLGSSSKYPNTQGIRYGFYIWGGAALCLIGYSIYLSFTFVWWSFIPGLLLGTWIEKVNKKSFRENCLDYALRNRDYYLDVMLRNGWAYQVRDPDALLVEVLTEVKEKFDATSEKKASASASVVEKRRSFNEASPPTHNKAKVQKNPLPAEEKTTSSRSGSTGIQSEKLQGEANKSLGVTTPVKENTFSLEGILMIGTVIAGMWLFFTFGLPSPQGPEVTEVLQSPKSSDVSSRSTQVISKNSVEEPVDFVGKSIRLKKSIATNRRVYAVGEQLVVVAKSGDFYKVMTQIDGLIQEDEVAVETLREIQK